MNNILSRIIADKWQEIYIRKQQTPQGELEKRARDLLPPRGFVNALRQTANPIALIAEVKRASPSKGLIRAEFDPVQIAQTYAGAGVDALSVLTDEKYFQGHLDYLSAIRAAVNLPLLRKDFILDPYQIYESRMAGADCILLIVAALPSATALHEFREEAETLGMDALVEVHTEEELAIALDSEATLIGINNRNLHTFETSLETTFRLLPQIPPSVTVVSESGITNRPQVKRLIQAGVHAMLVGESLMRKADPGQKVRELLGNG